MPITLALMHVKHRFFNIFRRLDTFYRYNGVLRIMQELYLEMGVYAFLNLYNIQFTNKEGLIVSAIAYVGMAWIVVFPIISFNIIQSNVGRYKSNHFSKRLHTLVEGTEV